MGRERKLLRARFASAFHSARFPAPRLVAPALPRLSSSRLPLRCLGWPAPRRPPFPLPALPVCVSPHSSPPAVSLLGLLLQIRCGSFCRRRCPGSWQDMLMLLEQGYAQVTCLTSISNWPSLASARPGGLRRREDPRWCSGHVKDNEWYNQGGLTWGVVFSLPLSHCRGAEWKSSKRVRKTPRRF